MENATKALEIAGSVLIGMLILGCIIYMYTQISSVKKIEQDATKIEQATDFNKAYDVYNRDNLYGSDLFSLANLIEDYNNKEAKDYEEIDITVIVKNQIRDAKYFVLDEYNAEKIAKAYKDLTYEIRTIGSKKYFGKQVSYWANYGPDLRLEQQLQEVLGNKYDANTSNIKDLKSDISRYNNYLSEQKDMARKNFKCTKKENDSIGRVKYMEFEEI